MCSHPDDTTRVPILLPDLGAEGQTVRLAQWLVKSGDHVLEHDRVVEVLLGGVLFHVQSPAEGAVHCIIETEGTPLHPGDILGTVSATNAN